MIPGGKIDLFRTVIATKDLMPVVNARGDECPKYLGRFQTKTIARAAPKMTKREEIATYLKEHPNSEGLSYKTLASELSRVAGIRASDRTIRRARGRK